MMALPTPPIPSSPMTPGATHRRPAVGAPRAESDAADVNRADGIGWDTEDGGNSGADQDQDSQTAAYPGPEVGLEGRAGIHREMGGGLEDGHDHESSSENR